MHGVNVNKPCDVLDLLFTSILEIGLNLALNLVVKFSRYQDAASLGEGFQSGGDVDSLTEDVATLLYDDIAEIQPDT